MLLYDGEYRDQWARADGLGAGVYLDGHVNAGGGDRGLVLHDHRGERGRALAEGVAGELGRDLGWRCTARVCRPDTTGVAREADFSEAFNTIAGVDAVALCLEPYFLDGPRRGEFLARLDEVGAAVARGIDG